MACIDSKHSKNEEWFALVESINEEDEEQEEQEEQEQEEGIEKRHASKENIGRTKNDSLSLKTLRKRIRRRRGSKSGMHKNQASCE